MHTLYGRAVESHTLLSLRLALQSSACLPRKAKLVDITHIRRACCIPITSEPLEHMNCTHWCRYGVYAAMLALITFTMVGKEAWDTLQKGGRRPHHGGDNGGEPRKGASLLTPAFPIGLRQGTTCPQWVLDADKAKTMLSDELARILSIEYGIESAYMNRVMLCRCLVVAGSPCYGFPLQRGLVTAMLSPSRVLLNF